MTKQEWLSEYGEDGQKFISYDGLDIWDFCLAHGIALEDDIIQLEDGTIFLDGGGWDFIHTDCVCGHCWESADSVPACKRIMTLANWEV